MNITDKQGIEWLISKLTMTDDSFRHSSIYRLLRDGLTKRGYWKAMKRGKPMIENLQPKHNVN